MNRRKSKAIRKKAALLDRGKSEKSFKHLNRYLKKEYLKLPWQKREAAI